MFVVFFIGDIFGKSGRNAVMKYLPEIKSKYSIDFVIANGENSAHGRGINKKIYEQLIEAGIDFITLGNHSWFREEGRVLLDEVDNMIRPMNLSEEFKYANCGVGTKLFLFKDKKIRVTNLIGSSVNFGGRQKNCFRFFEDFLYSLDETNCLHIVDLHAETTSEKNAFLWAFDGKISAVFGTHTHVATADGVITENNTAFVTDVGMTGPACGVIGGEKTSIIKKFFDPTSTFILDVQKGPLQLCGVIVEFDETTNKPVNIKQIIIKDGYKKRADLITSL